MAPPSDTLEAMQSSGASDCDNMILAGIRTARRSDFRLSIKPDSMDPYPVVMLAPARWGRRIVLTNRKRGSSNPTRVFVALSADLRQIDANVGSTLMRHAEWRDNPNWKSAHDPEMPRLFGQDHPQIKAFP